jgi:outer membrane protein assembly factor BamB
MRSQSLVAIAVAAVAAVPISAADWPMWGGTPERNQVNPREKGIPAEWDVEKGKNIKWAVDVGSRSYGNPVLAAGKIFVGTNNDGQRDPKVSGDKGVVMCFRASDGAFLWQAVHDKLASGRANDWPEEGICSSPCVVGNRVYYVSNRCELVCADTEGFLDGQNDGPYQDEKLRGPADADFIWVLDMFKELSVAPHNMATCSPVVVGDAVLIETSNGIDEEHENVPHPEAPSFLAVDRNTGKVLWKDSSPGKNILHGQWASPAAGALGGRLQVVFPGGDGVLYSFEPATGKPLWKFDSNPPGSKFVTGGKGDRVPFVATPVIEGDRLFIGQGDDPADGDGFGRFFSIQVTGEPGGALTPRPVWQAGGKEFRRSISTAAVQDGLVYIADLAGFIRCFDRETGKPVWVHDSFSAVWGSPYVVDGKVLVGNEDGDVTVFQAGRELKVLAKNPMGGPVYGTAIAAGGVLYIASRTKLFAIAAPAPAAPGKGSPAPAAPSSSSDWPMFRGDAAHTGVAAAPPAPAAPAPQAAAPRLAWTFASGEAPINNAAAIVGGTVYLATDGSEVAQPGELIAIDLETGKPRFRKKLVDEASFLAGPLVADRRIYIGDSRGIFHAFSTEDGGEAWSFKTESEIHSSATLVGERIVFGSYDSNLYCLSKDGALLWKLQSEGQVHASPAAVDGVVLMSGCDTQLRAVDVATGKELSATPMEGATFASPAASSELVYVATIQFQVLAIDWRKGGVVWTFEDPERQFPFHASPALIGGRLIVGGRDKRVRSLDAKTGKPQWTFVARGRVDSSPTVCGSMVYFGSSDGELYGLSVESGEKRFGFTAGAPLSASPAIGAGRLVIGAEDGRVYCFDLRAAGPAAPAGAPAAPPPVEGTR